MRLGNQMLVNRSTGAAALIAAPLIAGCGQRDAPVPALEEAEVASPAIAAYVGGQQCAGCHPDEDGRWRGSHHDLAMQVATPATVLGDFDGATFDYNGVRSEFLVRDGAYRVRTDGPDGELAEFRVTHAFGIEPLQQYLVELPDGGVQALSIAWDSRPGEEGGQRWFHLYPDEAIDHTDPLHWTGRYQSWNTMCAECHSTDLLKRYSAETDRFSTTFSEEDVSCEACHGPGSLHVRSPQGAPMRLPRDAEARWVFPDGASIAQRVPARPAHDEIEACAPCHARRSQFTDDVEPGDPLLDGFRPALLEPDLYHADGQILDEVYVYGSFLQSRMYAAGVTCGDCHDPHSVALRVDGNALCAQCHPASAYDVPAHHHHATDTPGAFCVDCHMPAQNYMVVDPRRDHSFRVPRPDLSEALDSPNACTACHQGQTDAWAAEIVASWFPGGRTGTPHYGEALHAGRAWSADRGPRLIGAVNDAAQPEIVRATALSLLAAQPDDAAIDAIEGALRTEAPLLQLAALEALRGLPPEARVQPAQRFLAHPLRALRMAAARTLVAARAQLSERRQADLEAALEEFRDAQRFNSDRAEGRFNLASLLADLGRLGEAEAGFLDAIGHEPAFAAAYINLADLYRRSGREPEAQELLQSAVANSPEDPAGHFALGLSLVRSDRLPDALAALQRAAELAPDTPYYEYVIGVALNSTGERERALETLEAVHERFPGHRETVLALATIHRDGGEIAEALVYARRLLALSPWDPAAEALIAELEQQEQ
jgi:predicted CXXCH cytochrome family protein